MNTNSLDELLSAYAKQPVPPPAARGTSEIWREIETRRGKSFWALVQSLFEWRGFLIEPRMAVAALALASVVGVLPGYFIVSRANAEAQLARRSLHFEVFSASATDLLANPQITAKL